jgi:hypothetical protein
MNRCIFDNEVSWCAHPKVRGHGYAIVRGRTTTRHLQNEADMPGKGFDL